MQTSAPASSSSPEPEINYLNQLPSNLYLKIVADHLDAPSQVCLALTSKDNMSPVTGVLSKSLTEICPKVRPEKQQRNIDGLNLDDLEDYERLMKMLWTWKPLNMIYCG
jgi:hypothetical protein